MSDGWCVVFEVVVAATRDVLVDLVAWPELRVELRKYMHREAVEDSRVLGDDATVRVSAEDVVVVENIEAPVTDRAAAASVVVRPHYRLPEAGCTSSHLRS